MKLGQQRRCLCLQLSASQMMCVKALQLEEMEHATLLQSALLKGEALVAPVLHHLECVVCLRELVEEAT